MGPVPPTHSKIAKGGAAMVIVTYAPRTVRRVLAYECEQWGRPFGHSGRLPVEEGPRTAVLLWVEGDRDEMQIAAEDPGRGVSAQALRTRAGSTIPKSEVIPMFFEKLTAWTLVVVYYTITCGAIVLGLKGAL